LSNLSDFKFTALNIGISIVPLMFALFYPKIGTILGYAASVSGFFMIYVIPVITYMKMRKIEILYPELATAIQQNEVEVVIPKRRTFPMMSPSEGGSRSMIEQGSTGFATGSATQEYVEMDPTYTLSPKLVINDRFFKRQGELIPVINRTSSDGLGASRVSTDNTEAAV
jgi:hypothetical protein